MGGEIVGVVADVRQRGLSAELFPSVFLPYNVFPGAQNSIVMRTRASKVAVETAVRAQVREVDPRLPVIGLSTMEQVVSDSVAQPRFYMTMLAVFAGIALVLAAIGIYGVISYTVAQRSRELGIRIALGATQRRVLGQVLGEGLTLTIGGVAIGLVAAFGLTRLISTMLFGVAAIDARDVRRRRGDADRCCDSGELASGAARGGGRSRDRDAVRVAADVRPARAVAPATRNCSRGKASASRLK